MYDIKVVLFGGAAGSGKSTSADMVEQICSKNTDRSVKVYKEALANPLKKMVKLAFPAFTNVDLYGPSKNRETPYQQYPFSGICVTCGKSCLLLTDVTKDGEGIRQNNRNWLCKDCSTWYPIYLTPRLALQTLGTEWGRRLSPNVWVEALRERIFDIYWTHRERDPQGHESPVPTTLLFVISDVRFENELRALKNYFDTNCLSVLLTRNFPTPQESTHESEQIHRIPSELWGHTIHNSDLTLDELYAALEPVIDSFVGGTGHAVQADAR